MVCWQYHSGEHRVGISTRVDGVRVGSNACSPGQKGKRVGVRTVSADTYQMFQFATVFTMGSYHPSPSPPLLLSLSPLFFPVIELHLTVA